MTLSPETAALLAQYAQAIGWEAGLEALAERALHDRLLECVPLAVRIANARQAARACRITLDHG